jgi:hypothetical protein
MSSPHTYALQYYKSITSTRLSIHRGPRRSRSSSTGNFTIPLAETPCFQWFFSRCGGNHSGNTNLTEPIRGCTNFNKHSSTTAMCSPMITATTEPLCVACPQEEQPHQSGASRKRVRSSSANRVRFCQEISTAYPIERLSSRDRRNKQRLWYTGQELQALKEMEIAKNRESTKNLSDEGLSWRGLEHLQYPAAEWERRAHCRSYVQVIIREYLNQKEMYGMYDPDHLAFVSKALSQQDREKAHHKGLQDELQVSAASTVDATLGSTPQLSRRRSSRDVISPHYAAMPQINAMNGLILWVLRILTIYFFYGILVAAQTEGRTTADEL